MNWFWKPQVQSIPELTTSILYNESTPYKEFVKDLLQAREEVIIESPYITRNRLNVLKPTFEKLIKNDIQVFILTRELNEQDELIYEQAEEGISYFESIGIQVMLIKGGHHRKLAIIDRKILWEGSLNILSQSQSREFMRKIESNQLTEELFHFLHFDSLSDFRKNLNLV